MIPNWVKTWTELVSQSLGAAAWDHKSQVEEKCKVKCNEKGPLSWIQGPCRSKSCHKATYIEGLKKQDKI